VRKKKGKGEGVGPWVQVSRLGNPLINEVVIPIGKTDEWNGVHPADDAAFGAHYEAPELAQLLPVLYPGVFPKLDALNTSGATRADLVAILLTGIPGGLIPGFQNFTGTRPADMLRLNMAIPPSASPSPLGLVGGRPRGRGPRGASAGGGGGGRGRSSIAPPGTRRAVGAPARRDARRGCPPAGPGWSCRWSYPSCGVPRYGKLET